MCSWCWAFQPQWQRLLQQLPRNIRVIKLLGGLAPDTDEPMPAEMRERLQSAWQRIEQTVPGTHFNFDFWSNNSPRRATYPACRAVLAARAQGVGYDEAMLEAIQRAYYQQARNPSNTDTLIALAREIGLDVSNFHQALTAPQTQTMLRQEIAQAEALSVDSYPSLVLAINSSHWPVPIDYTNADNILATIDWLLEESADG
jgi:putative protein-disulfide isomerase